MIPALPINDIKQPLLEAWRGGGAIVGAPPGSGKTTALPLWLLEESADKVFLLIPKRIAVKLAARQLAKNLGETVGQRVGIRLRNETLVSSQTKLIVTTYGSFLRALLNDPDEISGATVILDEFHERAIDQDLCYALINQYATELDDSVRRLIMSATLNVAKIADQTGLPVIESSGFSHPVDITYRKTDTSNAEQVAQLLAQLWRQSDHHLLAFFPGLKEMRAVERRLASEVPVLLLHSQLKNTPDISTLIQAPPTIILASNIAESSITLPGVHTVVDTGTERYVTTHPISGINELKTRRISQASAKQRAGRAGRLGPGKAIRLWSQDEHQSLVDHQPPEILNADLTSTVLHSIQWGSTGADLPWLDKPVSARWQLALNRLQQWRALNEHHQLTEHGQIMSRSGLDPWLAHLLTTAQAEHCFVAAAWLAAHLLQGKPIEYDPLSLTSDRHFKSELRLDAEHIARQFQQALTPSFKALTSSALIKSMSDRLVHWHDVQQGQLISGMAVTCTERQQANSWGIMLDGVRNTSKIICHQQLNISAEALFEIMPIRKVVSFHPTAKPNFRLTERMGNIQLSSKSCSVTPEQKYQAWSDYIQQQGENALHWCTTSANIRKRWHFAALIDTGWPEWPTADQWVDYCEPFLAGINRLEELNTVQILQHALGYEHLQRLEKEYPTHWSAPSGRRLELSYDAEEQRVSAQLKLQEIFGTASQPMLNSVTPISLSLNAPNGRPVAVVSDLPHFWREIYPQIRKELRGRYAKHPWPEDPLQFSATLQTNRQIRNQL